jgi:hypothetical protein
MCLRKVEHTSMYGHTTTDALMALPIENEHLFYEIGLFSFDL